MSTRRSRGRESEHALAEWLTGHGFPDARATDLFRPGEDIVGIDEWSIEVKSRSRLDLPAWLRQASRQAKDKAPLLVVRNNGQGVAKIGEWAAVQTLDQWARRL